LWSNWRARQKGEEANSFFINELEIENKSEYLVKLDSGAMKKGSLRPVRQFASSVLRLFEKFRLQSSAI